MLYSCSISKGDRLPNPEIKDGIAKLSGEIINFHPNEGKDNRMLTLTVPHPVTAETYEVTTYVDENGSFVFEEVAMQCDYAIGYIQPKFLNYNSFYVCLTSGKETKMEIICDETTTWYKSIHQTDSLGLTSTDLINMNSVARKLTNYGTFGNADYAKTPDEFVERMKNKLNAQMKALSENNTISEFAGKITLSDNAKTIIANRLRINMLDWRHFENRMNVQLEYMSAGNNDTENFSPPYPDKKYYAFLKDFDLNNAQYLYTVNYFSVLQKILSDETLNIPQIGDMPIDQWMKEAKKILSELVGFDKGLFYDLLATNSYAQQFDHQVKPLSDQQKENVRSYFKDEKSDIAKILLKKDNEISRLAVQKEPLVE